MTFPPNPYPSLDDAQYEAVVNGHYVKSTFSNGNAGCLSFTVAGGLVGVQDDKLPPAERKARARLRPARDGRLHRRCQERRLRPPPRLISPARIRSPRARLTTSNPGRNTPMPAGVGTVRGKDTTLMTQRGVG